MAVASTVLITSASLFVPFSGMNRYRGAVGTLDLEGDATGAAGGGTVSITFSQTDVNALGFRPLYVPKYMSTLDTASAEQVRATFAFNGNRRLARSMDVLKLSIARGVNNFAAWPGHDYKLVIEPDGGGSLIIFTWETNTDTKSYQANVFLVVYDLEALAKSGDWIPSSAFLNE